MSGESEGGGVVGVALRSPHTSCPASPLFLGAAAWLLAPPAGRKQVRQFEVGPGRLDDGHLPHGMCVTKSPHSPKVWSAGESSRGGRGGSRSTARSSLCLEGETLCQSLVRGKSARNTGKPFCLALVPLGRDLFQTSVYH